MYYFIIRKASGNVTLKKMKSAFGKFPHPRKPVTCTGSEMTRHVPGTVEQSKKHPNICTGTCVEPGINSIPRGKRQEVRSGYFAISLVNKLWDHILFPFLSLLWSHRFRQLRVLSKTSTTELAHSLGKFPTGTESQDPSVLGDGFERRSRGDQKHWTNACDHTGGSF